MDKSFIHFNISSRARHLTSQYSSFTLLNNKKFAYADDVIILDLLK
jgi:hypothetical protein